MKFSDIVARKQLDTNGDVEFSRNGSTVTVKGDKTVISFSVKDWEQMLETIDGGVSHAQCGKYQVTKEGDGLQFSLDGTIKLVITSTEFGTMKLKLRESAVDDLSAVEGTKEPKTLATAGGLTVIHYFDDDSVKIHDKSKKVVFSCPYPVWTQLR